MKPKFADIDLDITTWEIPVNFRGCSFNIQLQSKDCTSSLIYMVVFGRKLECSAKIDQDRVVILIVGH